MIYKTVPPHPSLAPFVEHFWLLAAPGYGVSSTPELVFPDGKTELIVHFGERFEKRTPNGCYEGQSRSLFAGQISEGIVLRGTGAVGIVAARFKAGGSARFTRVPHSE